jgi:hypothetical protein
MSLRIAGTPALPEFGPSALIRAEEASDGPAQRVMDRGGGPSSVRRRCGVKLSIVDQCLVTVIDDLKGLEAHLRFAIAGGDGFVRLFGKRRRRLRRCTLPSPTYWTHAAGCLSSNGGR